MSVKRIRNAATGLLATVALTMTAFVGLSGAAHAQQDNPPGGGATGCPYGAVCVYPDDSWNGGNPSYVFYSYGTHQIYNMYGMVRVYNNQYDDANVDPCRGSDGTDCRQMLRQGQYYDISIDAINSFRLWAWDTPSPPPL